jgi:hypothetical protein
LISTYKTLGPAIAISKGLDRDRAVDESGNQLAVFGRRGARPFNLAEMQQMYMHGGQLYTVADTPSTPAQPFKTAANAATNADQTNAALNALLPLPRTAWTQALVGGCGLLFIVVGWRRRRRAQNG